MAEIKVNTNGQILKVNASVSHWTTAALAVAGSGTNDVESTTTSTISSNYSMFFGNSATTALITVKDKDGTTLLAQTFDVSAGTGQRVLNPRPDPDQMNLSVQNTRPNLLDTGFGNYDRAWGLSESAATATGIVYLQYTRVPKADTYTKMRMYTGGTAAGATPDLARMGVYTVDESTGDVTLAASHASDTALFASGGTSYEKTITTLALTEGQLIAGAVLIVSSQTCPNFLGRTPYAATISSTVNALAPRLVGALAAQTDLPASIAGGSITNERRMLYFELRP